MAVLLAHQGGWDEALFVAVPVALFTLLLLRAKRNAEAEQEAEAEAAQADTAPGTAGGGPAEPGEH